MSRLILLTCSSIFHPSPSPSPSPSPTARPSLLVGPGRNDWGQLGKGDYVDRGDDPSTMGNNLTAVDLGSAPSGYGNGTAVATAVTTGQQFTCVLVEGGGVKVRRVFFLFRLVSLSTTVLGDVTMDLLCGSFSRTFVFSAVQRQEQEQWAEPSVVTTCEKLFEGNVLEPPGCSFPRVRVS